MHTATAPRTNTQATAPIGAGELHHALEAANASARLNAFTRTTGCAPAEVSPDCKSLSVAMVFDAMRARGYSVSAPVKATHQVRHGFTTWLVKVQLKGSSVTLAFFTSGEKP